DVDALSQDEFLCLSVAVWVGQDAKDAPSDRHVQSVAQSVKAQFQRILASHPRVRLPAVIESDCRELIARVRAAGAPQKPVSAAGLRLVERHFVALTA